MKNKTTVFFGFIGFISLLIGFVCAVVWFLVEIIGRINSEYFEWNLYTVSIPFSILGAYSGLHYIFATKFWVITSDPIKQLESDNQILKKKIERKELLHKLEN